MREGRSQGPQGPSERAAGARGTSMTPASLLIGILAGAVGVGYFVYGKRQTKFVPLVAGVLLCIYPYFLSSVTWMLAIGALLIAAPFLIDF